MKTHHTRFHCCTCFVYLFRYEICTFEESLSLACRTCKDGQPIWNATGMALHFCYIRFNKLAFFVSHTEECFEWWVRTYKCALMFFKSNQFRDTMQQALYMARHSGCFGDLWRSPAFAKAPVTPTQQNGAPHSPSFFALLSRVKCLFGLYINLV